MKSAGLLLETRSRFVVGLLRDLAVLEKDGAWELATLSFPDHWHLAPSFTRRASLAVSFPTLR